MTDPPARILDAAPADAALLPCLVVRDVAAAVGFHAAAFGAAVLDHVPASGRALISIAGSPLLLVAADRARGLLGAEHYGGAPVGLVLRLADVPAAVARAVAHGAVVLDDAAGPGIVRLRDPFLHVWHLAARDG